MFIWQYIILGPIIIKTIFFLAAIVLSVTISVILLTISKLNILNQKHKDFEEQFWSGIILEEMYNIIKKNPSMMNQPTGMLFSITMEEWVLIVQNKNQNTREPLERVKISIEKGLEKTADYIEKEFVIIKNWPIASLTFGFFSFLFLISNLFFSIGESGILDVSAIAKFIAAATLLSGIIILSSICCFVALVYLSQKAELYKRSVEDFSKDLYIILSREIEYNVQHKQSEKSEEKSGETSINAINDTEDSDEDI